MRILTACRLALDCGKQCMHRDRICHPGTFIVIDMVRLQLRRLCLLAEQGKAVDPAAIHQVGTVPCAVGHLA